MILVDDEEHVGKFIIVGAGFGGLALALRLSHLGHEIDVFEKNSFVGGRCHAVKVGGCEFDGGPTLLMMLDPFRKLFHDVGEQFDEHVSIGLCNPNYRVTFADGSSIDCSSNSAEMIAQIKNLSGEKDARSFSKMLGELSELYYESIPRFVRRNYDSFLPLLSPVSAFVAIKYGMLGNLARMMEKRFEDSRLQILFCLQTMYLGLSPKHAPSVYAVLTYMEYGEGIWYPKGGLNAIPQAIAHLAENRGTKIHLNTTVCQIGDRSVQLESGEVLTADAVICNADLPYAEKITASSRVRKVRPKNRRYSCSAFNIYIDYAGSLPKLLHHNIVLGGDFTKNLDQIFNQFEIPAEPAFYAAISSRAEPCMAPSGHENLYLLVPSPNLDHKWTDEDENLLLERVFARLEADFDFDRNKISDMKTVSPRDWQNQFNLDKGATFGLSHDFFQSVCFRPSNRSRNIQGLFYVGASTNPGNGLPMTLISAELAEERLRQAKLI